MGLAQGSSVIVNAFVLLAPGAGNRMAWALIRLNGVFRATAHTGSKPCGDGCPFFGELAGMALHPFKKNRCKAVRRRVTDTHALTVRGQSTRHHTRKAVKSGV